jgi:predicted secreted acid phosphatase
LILQRERSFKVESGFEFLRLQATRSLYNNGKLYERPTYYVSNRLASNQAEETQNRGREGTFEGVGKAVITREQTVRAAQRKRRMVNEGYIMILEHAEGQQHD